MFNNISWQEFFIGIALIAGLYYLVVSILYFKKKIFKHFIAEDRDSSALKENNSDTANDLHQKGSLYQLSTNENHGLLPEDTNDASCKEQHDILFNSVHDLVDELKTIFFNASKNKLSRKELKNTLRLKLKNYSHLKGTAFQVALNNSIQTESQTQCSIYLNEDELKMLWR